MLPIYVDSSYSLLNVCKIDDGDRADAAAQLISWMLLNVIVSLALSFLIQKLKCQNSGLLGFLRIELRFLDAPVRLS